MSPPETSSDDQIKSGQIKSGQIKSDPLRRDQVRPAETVVSLTGNHNLARRLPLFDVCVLLTVIGLACAIAFRRPGVLALAAPFLAASVGALGLWRPIEGTARVRFDTTRVVEGQDLTVFVEVTSATGIDRLEVEVYPSPRFGAHGSLRAVSTVKANSTTKLSFAMAANEWGIGRINRITLRVTDRFAMFGGETVIRPNREITIGLPEDRITASLEAERFRRIVGSHMSADRGEGLEIADVRPFQPGDSTRHLNWRISNRRQEPWVTLRHPDRSSTVIVIVDAHDGEDEEQRRTQRRSVTAALALARGHLAMHDRVGLLVVGHTVRWLPPKLGRTQLFEIADQLMTVSNAPEASRRMYRPPVISSIPSNSIVVAVSPLRDPLMVSLVAELRGRGNPVSVLVPHSSDPKKRARLQSRVDEQARRLASVEQRIGEQSLRERGVAIVAWSDDEPVVSVIASIQRLRQSIARARSC